MHICSATACGYALANAGHDTRALKLKSDWSPEQIAGRLKRAYPEDEHYLPGSMPEILSA
jgi:hypothetical protein